MKISPMFAPTNSVTGQGGQAPAPSLRSIRMSTNATPGRDMQAPQEQAPPEEQKLSIPTTSEGQVQAPTEETKALSPQLAAIAKQRRALQVKERELQELKKSLDSGSSTQRGHIPLERLKSEPLSVLLEAGVTYDQLTEAILANQSGTSPELQSLKAKVAELETGFDSKLKERDAQAEQQVLAEMKRQAMQLSADGEAFELVRETKSIPDVMDLIERTYRETGDVLDVEEALQLVEDELLEESRKRAQTKKIRDWLSAQQAPQLQAQQRPGMRTLTNRDTAVPPMSAKQRALLAFRGQYNK